MIISGSTGPIAFASEAKQSREPSEGLDCFVALAPRNDDLVEPLSLHPDPAILALPAQIVVGAF
jgi:hypothetical protein